MGDEGGEGGMKEGRKKRDRGREGGKKYVAHKKQTPILTAPAYSKRQQLMYIFAR